MQERAEEAGTPSHEVPKQAAMGISPGAGALTGPQGVGARRLLMLQRSIGNRAVGQLLQRQDPRHARGYAGEQGLGFQVYRFGDGWAIVRGPSGSSPGGHGTTRPGEDGLAYNVRTGELHIVDNKSFARAGNVQSATAIDPQRTLVKNLRDMTRHVESQSLERLPMRQEVLSRLRKTTAAILSGQPLPARVSLIVANAGGRSTGISERLARQGIRFLNVQQPVLSRPGTATPPLLGGPAARPPPSPAPAPASPPAPKTSVAPASPKPKTSAPAQPPPTPKTSTAKTTTPQKPTAPPSPIAGRLRSIGTDLIIGLLVDLISSKIKEHFDQKSFEQDLRALQPQIDRAKQQSLTAFYASEDSPSPTTTESGPLYFNIRLRVKSLIVIVVAGAGSRTLVTPPSPELESVAVSSRNIKAADKPVERALPVEGGHAVYRIERIESLTYSEPIEYVSEP